MAMMAMKAPAALLVASFLLLQEVVAANYYHHSSYYHGRYLQTELVLETKFDFGLFPDAEVRNATYCEIEGLMNRTSEWFFLQLQSTYPSLQSFEAEALNQGFSPEAGNPITIHFDSSAVFEEGGTIPTVEELFAEMQNQDFTLFIQEAVWTTFQTSGGDSGSGDIFDQVQESNFNARVAGDLGGTDLADVATECVDNGGGMVADEEQEQAEDEDDTMDCAMALTGYRESNGENWTQVHLDCLMSGGCAAGDASMPSPKGTSIECRFTEFTNSSSWGEAQSGECQTNNTENSVELGKIFNFSLQDADWSKAPLVGDLAEYNTTLTEGVKMGFTMGCTGDKYVYLMSRNDHMREGWFQVIGYQTLEAFGRRFAVEFTAPIGGQAISGISPDSECAFGNSVMVDLIGSCRLLSGDEIEAESDGAASNNGGGMEASSNGDSDSTEELGGGGIPVSLESSARALGVLLSLSLSIGSSWIV